MFDYTNKNYQVPSTSGYTAPAFYFGYNNSNIQGNIWAQPSFTSYPTGQNMNSFWDGYNSSSTSDVVEDSLVYDSNSDSKINITRAQKKALKEEQINAKIKENIDAKGSFGSNLAIGAGFMSYSIGKYAKVKKNAFATTMFTEIDDVTKKAKYAQLYKKAPIVMTEAQDEFAKAARSYEKALEKATKKGLDKTYLIEDFRQLSKKMETALKSGNADDVAKATEQLRAANKVKYKHFFKEAEKGKRFLPTKNILAEQVNVSNVTTKTGNSFFRNMGGGLGAVMAVLGSGLMIFSEIPKIKEAKKQGKEAHRKQIGQTVAKAMFPAGAYLLGDGIGKTLVNKWLPSLISDGFKNSVKQGLSKCVRKILPKLATKLATKGACKGIGAALGSFIPGLGTIAGLVIGTALDVILSKHVVPKIFGEIDIVDENNIKAKSNKDLLTEACDKAINQEALTELEEKIIQANPTFCSNYINKKQAELAQAQGAA